MDELELLTQQIRAVEEPQVQEDNEICPECGSIHLMIFSYQPNVLSCLQCGCRVREQQ